jgi:hypothetical protein
MLTSCCDIRKPRFSAWFIYIFTKILIKIKFFFLLRKTNRLLFTIHRMCFLFSRNWSFVYKLDKRQALEK